MRVLAVPALVLLVACGRKPEAHPVFPELARVDPQLVERLRPAVEAAERASWDLEKGSARDLATLARAEGAPAAWALLKLRVEHYAQPPGMFSTAQVDKDQTREAPAWLMGELADDGLRAALQRGLASPELHPRLRREFVIALCRKGNAGALDALVDRAVDRREDPDVREAVLLRLPRLEVPPPRRLREALCLPFSSLDHVAAATLACMGDPEAPSLVLEGLELAGERRSHLSLSLPQFIAAGNAVTGGDLAYSSSFTLLPGEDSLGAQRRLLQPHIDALKAWLESHPAQTQFEKERREYLASEQRKRELSLQSFDDVLAAGEDFDLASAILLLTCDAGREGDLERLDRLARLVRRRLAGVEDPEARIAVLNETLLQDRHEYELGDYESGQVSRLDVVLASDSANCMGFTTLYLAIGERCGLPLYGVSAPGHIFVRYDDGTFRRNIEATALGTAQPDEHYVDDAIRRAPEVLEQGLYLRNLTKRQVLASALNNTAGIAAYFALPEEARELAAKAIRLDPGFALAYRNRAFATFHATLDADDEVLADLERAARLHPGDAECRLVAGNLLHALGRYDRAEQFFAAAEALEPSAAARHGRAACLARLGRGEEARALLDGEEDLVVDLVLAPAEVDPAALEGRGEQAAEILLSLDPPQASTALQLLDGNEAPSEPGFPGAFEALSASHVRRDYHALRARVLALLGRMDEARAELAEAEKAGGLDRQLLLARAACAER